MNPARHGRWLYRLVGRFFNRQMKDKALRISDQKLRLDGQSSLKRSLHFLGVSTTCLLDTFGYIRLSILFFLFYLRSLTKLALRLWFLRLVLLLKRVCSVFSCGDSSSPNDKDQPRPAPGSAEGGD